MYDHDDGNDSDKDDGDDGLNNRRRRGFPEILIVYDGYDDDHGELDSEDDDVDIDTLIRKRF